MPRFVPIEAHRIDESLDSANTEAGHCRGRICRFEQTLRRGQRGGILRSCRKQCRYQDFEGIFLARLGNLLDRRKLEAVNRASQGSHDRPNVSVARRHCRSVRE
jgi:hypothetical protein